MVLYDVFYFLINYNSYLPELLVLWLRQFKIIHQISFIYFIYNNLKLDYGSIKKTKKHENCKCKFIYDQLHIKDVLPLENILKCVADDICVENINRNLIVSTIGELTPSKYNFEKKNVQFANISANKIVYTNYEHDRMIVNETGIFENQNLTIYGIKLLVQSPDFKISKLIGHLDCIEICVLNVLLRATAQRININKFTLELFLPEYLRTLRTSISMVVASSATVPDNLSIKSKPFNQEIKIIQTIYDFINRRSSFTSIPISTYSIREFDIGCVTDLSKFNDMENCLVQLNYVGNKMYINVINGKIYVFDDFGRKVNITIEAKFNKNDNFLIECVRLTKGVLYSSGYAEGKFICIVTDVLLWYNNYLQTSFEIRSKIIPFFVKTMKQKSFLPAATYRPNEIDDLEKLFYEELKINKLNNLHFNGLVFKNINNNMQWKYKYKSSKYVIVGMGKNKCQYKFGRDENLKNNIVDVHGIIIPDTETIYTAYFLVNNIIRNNLVDIYVYNRYRFELYMQIKTQLKIKFHHTYKIKVKRNKFKRFAIVKIGFNSFINDKLNDIKFIRCTPTKHIMNVVTLEQLKNYFT